MSDFGFLVIDKPLGLTSHDVIGVVRRGVNQRRVGHAGTLDPLATGVLVVCIGSATRLSEYVMGRDKTYRALIRLGEETPTYDLESKVICVRPIDHLDRAQVLKALEAFQGEVDQIPPMHSAVKQNGKKLYQLARRGKEVERPPRRVHLQTRLIRCDLPEVELEIICSAGTYIRSIAHDLGTVLGVGGHLAGLRRLSSGELDNPVPLALLRTSFEAGDWRQYLIDEQKALAHLPALHLEAEGAADILNGRLLNLPQEPRSGTDPVDRPILYRAYDPDGRFIAIVKPDPSGSHYQPEKVFLP